MAHDGTKNLKLIQSTDEARERGKKGGIASGVARRRKKSMGEALDLLLSMPVYDSASIKKIKATFPDLSDEDIDNQMLVVVGALHRAAKGYPQSLEFIRDTIGEKPIDKHEQVEPVTVVFEGESKLAD